MRALGIVQRDDPILRQIARPFELPEEAEDARRVIAELSSAMERVETAHTFGKGMGIAAPQIGISRAAAVVRTTDGETITLINPRIVEEMPGDEQYEGCLSFFDVRGMVPRPLEVHVEHQDVDGGRRITIFGRGVARRARDRPLERGPLHRPHAARSRTHPGFRVPPRRPAVVLLTPGSKYFGPARERGMSGS